MMLPAVPTSKLQLSRIQQQCQIIPHKYTHLLHLPLQIEPGPTRQLFVHVPRVSSFWNRLDAWQFFLVFLSLNEKWFWAPSTPSCWAHAAIVATGSAADFNFFNLLLLPLPIIPRQPYEMNLQWQLRNISAVTTENRQNWREGRTTKLRMWSLNHRKYVSQSLFLQCIELEH